MNGEVMPSGSNSQTTGLASSAYDPLNRLTAFRRGTLSSSGNNGTTLDTVTTASTTNSWSLDAVGNSTSTGGTSRTVNSKNQITAISGLTTPTYDHDGNMTKDQAGNTYDYDAWNRLVEAVVSGNNEEYTYNAGGARPGLSICNGAVTSSYYSTNWQDLEDDIVVSGPCGNTTTKSTYLWSEAYIDELVARDTSVNGGSVTRVYAQQDANEDVTSLVNSTGTVLERFVYDPYGKQTVLNASWSTTSDSYNWVYGFQGGRLDPFDGLVNFRNRDLNPTTGTWMEQDPAGYIDGSSVYQFENSSPVALLDPSGLSWDQGGPATPLPPSNSQFPRLAQDSAGSGAVEGGAGFGSTLLELGGMASAMLGVTYDVEKAHEAINAARYINQTLDDAEATDEAVRASLRQLKAQLKAQIEARAQAKAERSGGNPERTPAENKKARNKFKNNKDAAREAWEKRTGNDWPEDENGNPWPAHHPDSLKSGGDPMYVEPQDPDGIDPHNIPGPDGKTDYQRWGAQGTPARQANE